MRLLAVVSNLKIRTNLILVLLFFVAMLLVGAALGVLSLRQSNQVLNGVMNQQTQERLLNDSIEHYKNMQIDLGRALELAVAHRAEIQLEQTMREYVTVGPFMPGESQQRPTVTPDPQSLEYLEKARESFNQSKATFEQYRKSVATETAPVFSRVANAYQSLMAGGVEPLFDYLGKGDVDGYHAFYDSTGAYQLDDLYGTVAKFRDYQKNLLEQTHASEADQYSLVLKLVSVGIAVSVLISVLVYFYLGRVVLRPLRQAGEHFDRIASGDLTQRISMTARNEIGVLYEAVRRMQESLIQTVAAVRAGVDEINTGAHEIFSGNTDLSTRTEQQAASLQETAASMEQLAGTVRQNTEHAQHADKLSQGASGVAQRGGKAMGEVVRTMEEISASSGRISEIVGVIDGIAFQTNILALNAAVEAARAGEQGKGFAVVAGEVRSLAQRSAQAAREIKTLIDESLETIGAGSRQAGEAGKIMEEVVESILGVTAIMGDISSASREQADGISQVTLAVAQMDGVVQQNAALVDEAAAAAGSLQDQAARLAEAVRVFKLEASAPVRRDEDMAAIEQPRRLRPSLPLPALSS